MRACGSSRALFCEAAGAFQHRRQVVFRTIKVNADCRDASSWTFSVAVVHTSPARCSTSIWRDEFLCTANIVASAECELPGMLDNDCASHFVMLLGRDDCSWRLQFTDY